MVRYHAASSRRYKPCASTSSPTPDRAAEQMRELQDRQRHEMAQPVQTLTMPGVEPENSSTAPAPNTAIALACGVTVLSQVRPSCADTHHGAAMHPELVRAQQRQRHGERHEIIDDAIGEQRTRAAHPAALSWNSSSSTDSNTPTPPGTLLMMPAAMAMMKMAGERREADRAPAAAAASTGRRRRIGDRRTPRAICAKAMRGLGTGITILRQRNGSCRLHARSKIGRSRPRAACSRRHDDRAMHMQHRGRQRGLRQQRQAEQRRGPQAERQRAERDHGRDLLGR